LREKDVLSLMTGPVVGGRIEVKAIVVLDGLDA